MRFRPLLLTISILLVACSFAPGQDCNSNGIPDSQEVTRIEPAFSVGYARIDDHPSKVVLGDLDGDGDMDAAVAFMGTCCTYPGGVRILRNDGGPGSMTSAGVVNAGIGSHAIAMADLDGDGDLDLATVDWIPRTVSILLNQGNASFVKGMAISVPDRPGGIAAGDFDHDGRIDLAVTHDTPTAFSILTNDGHGAFHVTGHHTAEHDYYLAIAAADIDANGTSELALVQSDDNVVSIWRQSPHGLFVQIATVPIGDNPHEIALTDLNGDGKPDLAISQDTRCCPQFGEVVVALNQGNGLFGAPTTYAAARWLSGLAAGDFDRDADVDLMVSDIRGQLWPLLNRGDGSFVLRQAVPLKGPSYQLATSDLDGDGDAEVVGVLSASDDLTILTNTPESVSNDCNGNGRLDSCDVAAGTRYDYDKNDIPDECDFQSGFSVDCNGNGISDEYDLRIRSSTDCTNNYVPDECDLLDGTENDCNHNNRPDSCDPDSDENGTPDDCEVPQIIYVDPAATGANNGRSWPDAFTDLNRALETLMARSVDLPVQIWVANGIYRPTWRLVAGEPRSATFPIWRNLGLYGGFAGGEQRLEDRRPAENPTILSGDLAGDDGPGFTNIAENCFHVVVAFTTGPATALDGFIIEGGCANGYGTGDFYNHVGGGLYLHEDDEVGRNEPTVANCIFRGNKAGEPGGAVYVRNSCPTFVNCTFNGNSTSEDGGALAIVGLSKPMLVNCSFIANIAGAHGGVAVCYSPESRWVNCRFLGNRSGGGGGALNAEGGIATLSNCLFSGNHAATGGGAIYNSVARLVLVNCTLAGNSTDTAAGGIHDMHGLAVIHNSVLWGNRADEGGSLEQQQIVVMWDGTDIHHSCVEGWTGALEGLSNFGLDPLLTDPDGADNVPGTPDDNLHLRPRSPCIDVGDNQALPADVADLDQDGDMAERIPLDLDGLPRLVNYLGGTDTMVDVGAYEVQSDSVDCNGNGMPDPLDIASGAGQDCTGNGVPDECDLGIVAFTDSFTLDSGHHPHAIVPVDMNADGRIDLVISDEGHDNHDGTCTDGAVAIRYNWGGNSFNGPRVGLMGQRPTDVAVADFASDGRPDIAVCFAETPQVALVSISAGGAIHMPVYYPLDGLPVSIAAGDFNCDGRPDLAVGAGDGLSIMPAKPDGTLGPPEKLATGFFSSAVAVGDLESDGDLDLAIADQGNMKVAILLNCGDGSFADPVFYSEGMNEIAHLTARDLNGDGRLDLAIADLESDHLLVMLNTGNAAFSPPVAYGLNGGPRCVTAGDLDGDGDQDLALVGYDGTGFTVFLNNGDGSFGPMIALGLQSFSSAAVVDINGDGRNDLLGAGPDGAAMRVNRSDPPTSHDCNRNHVPDECDVAAGTSNDQNGDGIPDECEQPPCVAQRKLPPAYAPHVPLTAAIEVKPNFTVAAYAVEDKAPAGWVVGAVNEGGAFDAATGKVKWGPFLDHQARTLTYEFIAPADAFDRRCFGPGGVSLDGHSVQICGDDCIGPCYDHPADTSHDKYLVIDEVTAYAAAWKRGQTWPTPPNPIHVGYVTRAGALWKNGETYCCDLTQIPPLMWVNCLAMPPSEQSAPGDIQTVSAVRTLVPTSGCYAVVIKAAPAGAAAYALEESPPRWPISNISDDGYYDAAAEVIRWGPFHDGAGRTLTYRLMPPHPATVGRFAGVFSADGADQAAAGLQVIAPVAADRDRDWDVDPDDIENFESCMTGPHMLQAAEECRWADLDGDTDVDQSDFGVVQRCYSGRNVPADPNCST